MSWSHVPGDEFEAMVSWHFECDFRLINLEDLVRSRQISAQPLVNGELLNE